MRNRLAALLRSAVEWFEKKPRMKPAQSTSREELRAALLELLSEPATARQAAPLLWRVLGVQGGAPGKNPGFLAKSNTDASDVEDSIAKEVSGKIGVGTETPGARLESFVTAAEEIPLRLNTNFGGGNPVDFYPYIPGVNNAGFQLSVGQIARLTISPGGNVGIGTTTPSVAKLQVAAGGDPSLYLSSTLRYKLGLNHGGDTAKEWWLVADTNGDFAIHENLIGDRLTIQDATGNVGIGTPSPQNKLHVEGGNVQIGSPDGNNSGWRTLLLGTSAKKQSSDPGAFGPEMITAAAKNSGDAQNRRVVMWAGAEGDVEAMFMINSNGILEWGEGGDKDQDIFLSRTDDDQLTLTDTFVVAKPAVAGPSGDRQPRIMLKHEGGGIIFGYGVDTPPDIAVFRPSPGTTTPNKPGISINSFIGDPGKSPNTFRVNMPSAFVGVEGPELFAVDSENKAVRIAAPITAPPDPVLNNASISFWLDEGTPALKVKVKLSTGLVKTGTITLV